MTTLGKSKNGMTLIEIAIAIGIMTLIVSFSMVTDLNFLKSDALRSEESIIVSALVKARSRSMSNLFQSAHGFCYISPNYVVFRDSPTTRCVSGVTTNELIPANINIANNSSTIFPGPVIFSQLAGTTTDGIIHITDGIKSEDITINYEGRINW